MLSTSPMARLVSVSNATRMLRALPKRTFASSPSSASASSTRFSDFFTHNKQHEAMATRYNLSRFGSPQQTQSSRLFSSSSFAARPSTTSTPFTNKAAPASSPFIQGQAIRGFSRKAWHAERESAHQAAREQWHGAHGHGHGHGRGEHDIRMQARWGRCGGGFRGYHDHRMMRRRRPMRFLFRMMVLSTVLVAAPAVIVFDAPCETLAYVPLTVFGVGGVLMLTGRLLYVALPVLAVGGAAAFWVTTMPAANTVKDLKKLLKRDENAGRYSTALSTLGSDWEIQRAQPNEWFRWTFPERGDKKQLDKIDVRMAIFDSNDHSDRKEKTMRFLDKFQGMNDNDGFKRGHKKGKHGNDCELIESIKVKREGDQFVIHMEEDGEKIMEQKVAKKYLALGRIVDRAAKEMEAAQPGLKLGDQVVLVHKNKSQQDSFWSRWSPYGDLSLRIPFSRTWVNDLSDL